jgi:hypothetical protein
MTDAWGSGPVDMSVRCRLDEPGREVSRGSLVAIAGVTLVGLTFSWIDSLSAETKTTPTKTDDATKELRMPARPIVEPEKP